MRTRYKEVKCFESDAMHILHERKEKNKGFDTTPSNLILLYRVRCAIICAGLVCVSGPQCAGISIQKKANGRGEKQLLSTHGHKRMCPLWAKRASYVAAFNDDKIQLKASMALKICAT